VSWKVVVWVLRPERAVMFSGGLEGGYVGAPTNPSTMKMKTSIFIKRW